MIRRTAALAGMLALAAGAAHAQVASDDDYERYFDFIVSNPWVCSSDQPSDMMEGGRLQMNWEFHFQRSGSDGYRFTGWGKASTRVENRDYSSSFNFEGFGFNDSSFGTGVSIKTLTMTGGSPGWSWHDGENLQLHLEQVDNGKWKLVGYELNYDDNPPSEIDFDCGGPEDNG
ncbi:MAG TPA: hypothetical protein VG839_03955 [Asticcacaulis sp.]|nr:hypothetical protein [Asticcacaulis sp.]